MAMTVYMLTYDSDEDCVHSITEMSNLVPADPPRTSLLI